jgi:phosphatidylinositol glycan class B
VLLMTRAPRWLLPALVAARVIGALLVVTYFNPDEYWQSLEVAHRWVFGCVGPPPCGGAL